jgi:Fe2+ or Zn2+ uptake regulation protein
VKKLYDAKELTVREIASLFNITPPTVYRALEVA